MHGQAEPTMVVIAPPPHHQRDFQHYPLLCTTTLASLVKGEVLSPEKIRATTGGIASPPSFACTNPCFAPPHLPPLSKVRCCRPKKFVRLPEGLSLHQPFQNRTIPFAFRRASVCVCLYGFVFALSLSLFVGEELVSRVTWFTLCASTWFTCYQ